MAVKKQNLAEGIVALTDIVLASANTGKLVELQHQLNPLSINLSTQAEHGVSSVAETGYTFVENALIKARHASQATQLPALADDSGLQVPALNGAPGIYSARYAGNNASDHDNNLALLTALANVPEAQRQASYYCCLVLLRHPADPTPLICQGEWHGRILFTPQGAGGFGYDPIFLVPEHHCSAAELPAAQKNQLSHRGQAVRQLVQRLQR